MSQTPFPRLPTIPFPPLSGATKPGWSQGGPGGPAQPQTNPMAINTINHSTSVHTMSFPAIPININPSLGLGPGSMNPTTGTNLITSAQRQAELRELIEKERLFKMGSENLLEALNGKKSKAKGVRGQRQIAEAEVQSSVRRLEELRLGLEDEIQRGDVINTADTTGISLGGTTTIDGSTIMGLDGGVGPDGMALKKEESPSVVLTGLLHVLGAESMAAEYYIDLANKLAELFKTHPAARFEVSWPVFGPRMQNLILYPKREVVAAAYRAIRCSITDRRSLQIVRGYRLDVPIINSLGQTRAVVEREQALKLVRAFVDVPDGVCELEPAIVNVVVAIADQPEDRLRGLAVLTIAEITVRDVRVIRRSRGLAVLANSIGGGMAISGNGEPSEKAGAYSGTGGYAVGPIDGLARALLHAYDVDRDGERAGLEGAVTVFSEGSEAEPAGLSSRVAGAVQVAAAALRTWPGLVAMAGDDAGGVRALLAGLEGEIPVINGALDVIVDVLGLARDGGEVREKDAGAYDDDGDDEIEGIEANAETGGEEEEEKENISNHLISQYRALLLAIFVRIGLLPGLASAWRRTKGQTKQRLLSLLVAVQGRAAFLGIPTELGAGTGQFDPTLDGNNKDHSAQDTRITNIHGLDLVYAIASAQPQASHLVGKRPHPDPPDEAAFRQMMLDTGVLSTRNPSKWRWDTIEQVINGPLRSAARLEEALKTSRFVGRLLSFYRPFNGRFATLPNTAANQKYVHTGCALVRALLRHPSGVRTLADSKLIRQLAECIAQFDPSSGLVSSTPIFSAGRVSDTLACGYFAIIGALSSRRAGVAVLARWRVWNMLLHVVDRPDRPDLSEAILASLDYRVDSLARVVLSRALSGPHAGISTRVFATGLLRPHAIRPNPARKWAIGLLLTQLYDPDLLVCEKSVAILAEACVHPAALATVVARKPALDHLGELAAPLLLRFLATSAGYEYLAQLDYMARQMDDWFLGRNEEYVAVVEGVLHLKLMTKVEKTGSSRGGHTPGMRGRHAGQITNEGPSATEVGWPPHFYRELVRTPDGCDLLRSKSHFSTFCQTIMSASGLPRSSSKESLSSVANISPTYSSTPDGTAGGGSISSASILKIKAALWVVGNIGSTPLGSPFLDDAGIVPHIVRIAQTHSVLSIRGTAFYVLSLVSRSELGDEMLRMAHWEGLGLGGSGQIGEVGRGGITTSIYGCLSESNIEVGKSTNQLPSFPSFEGPVRVRSDTIPSPPSLPSSRTTAVGISAPSPPNDMSASVAFPSFPPLPIQTTSSSFHQGGLNHRPLPLSIAPTAEAILRTIPSLSSALTSKRAAARLQALKHSHPHVFDSPEMWRRVVGLMGTYHFRLPAVKFLVEGFGGWKGVVMDWGEEEPVGIARGSSTNNELPVGGTGMIGSKEGGTRGVVNGEKVPNTTGLIDTAKIPSAAAVAAATAAVAIANDFEKNNNVNGKGGDAGIPLSGGPITGNGNGNHRHRNRPLTLAAPGRSNETATDGYQASGPNNALLPLQSSSSSLSVNNGAGAGPGPGAGPGAGQENTYPINEVVPSG